MQDHPPEGIDAVRWETQPPFLAHLDGARSQLLRDHLLAVSALTERRAAKLGLGPAGALIGLLHDLGKYSAEFQCYLAQITSNQDTEEPELRRGDVDHSTAGAQQIWRTLRSRGVHAGIVGQVLALCVASHHSGMIDCVAPDGTDRFSRRMDKVEASTHLNETWRKAEPLVVAAFERIMQNPGPVDDVRLALQRICRAESAETPRRFNAGLLVRYLFSCLIDADRTDTADFSSTTAASLRQHGNYTPWTVLIERAETALASLGQTSPVDELRRQVSRHCLDASERPKGIYTLTVPTGGGKTLASLRFALRHAAKWHMDRIIYVSPYTSIIDQNADVVRRVLEPPDSTPDTVVLEHHSNLAPEKQTWRSKILTENWDAPVVFTTAVQVMEALFGGGTRSVRRMHQMANSVLIFDEVQTIPVRCVHIFNNALNFLAEQAGATVMLCTATQPLLDRVDACKGAVRFGPNAEIVPHVADLFGALRRCEAFDRRKPGGWGHREAARLAVDEARRSGSCLVVVNTKGEALSIFNECRSIETGSRVLHLSTGMCPVHRMKILRQARDLIAAGTEIICVSTQLIEAGVDISFGAAIRALAGMDSIAQTAGRCNRHGELAIGHLHVVNLAGELPKALSDIRLAQESTQRVLDENRNRDLKFDLWDPKITAQYFHYYFFGRQQDMDYPVGPEKADRDDSLLNLLAENGLAASVYPQPPPIWFRQAFRTAAEAFEPIDAKTRGVVVPYTAEGKAIIGELCSAYDLQKQNQLIRRAQRFAVSVFPHTLTALRNANAVHEVQTGSGVLYLDEKYYSEEFGLNIGGTEEMRFQSV